MDMVHSVNQNLKVPLMTMLSMMYFDVMFVVVFDDTFDLNESDDDDENTDLLMKIHWVNKLDQQPEDPFR